jgi:phosphoribosylglycinamide formyltransferase-1
MSRTLSAPNRRIGVLISGRGSNLVAIMKAIDAGTLNAIMAVVISNRREAAGLSHASAAGIETVVLSQKAHASRDAYDEALGAELLTRNVGLVCLAGFMRLVGAPLLQEFPDRVLNIHPSLLPAFPGLDAQQQALDHGVKVAGVTVHLVGPGLDDGPILAQTTVPVLDDDTVDTLSGRILIEEHKLYPAAIGRLLDGEYRLEGRRVFRTAAMSSHSSASGSQLPGGS